jgi:hypothetical protein
MVGLERFQCDHRIAKILVANLVEVVAPDIDVQILGPIVFHPLVDHLATGDEFLDAVGGIAERRFEYGGADVALLARGVRSFPPVPGQHPELPEDDRHFMIAGGAEPEGDFALAALLHFLHVAIEGADEGIGFLECLEGKDHVLDRDRGAVVVTRGRAQAKGDGCKVRGVTDLFGDQPVVGHRFVERCHHQRVANRAGGGGEQTLEAGDHLVEVVERAERCQAQRPAFRRLRIDVVEMLEAGRILGLARQRQTVSPLHPGALRARRRGGPQDRARPGRYGRKRAGAKNRATGQTQGNLRKPSAEST